MTLDPHHEKFEEELKAQQVRADEHAAQLRRIQIELNLFAKGAHAHDRRD